MQGGFFLSIMFKTTDEKARHKHVLDYIRHHQGCLAEEVVTKIKPGLSRRTVFKVLKDLKNDSLVTEQKINMRMIKLFVNDSNPLISVPQELEIFEKHFRKLLQQVKKVTDVKYKVAINNLQVPDKEKLNSTDKEITQIVYDFSKLNSQPLYILYAVIDAYLFHSILTWPLTIRDKETLKDLYTYVFKKIGDIQEYLFETFKSIYIGASGSVSQIIAPYIENRLHMTTRLSRCIDIYTKFDMQNEIEDVIDSLWKIQGRLQFIAYPEPRIYSWKFEYYEDDWRKLLNLQKERPEQTFRNYIYNTIEQSGFSKVDEVVNSEYMKLEREKRKTELAG